uniref:NADH-ubiquinone oxidoreductase chain 2 n=1 Tax=Tremex columba TaxID=222809 RepID=A0A3G5BC68_TRECO|nr:NADH dehydrogenase subunit 2 [Tremex columba]AYV97230.1 NADH dehydrogenase subunit 2 [Tremex columba]
MLLMPNFIKMIIFPLIIMNLLLMSSCTSFIFLWILFEFSLILFSSLIMNNSNKSHESSYIYFIPQILASILFFFSCTQLLYSPIPFMFINKKFFSFIITLSMALKLGMAPMHFWFISVCETASWFSILLLSTLMKLPPLLTMFYFKFEISFWFLIIFFSVIFSLMGINSSSLKKIIGFSSMNQLSWIVMIMNFSKIFLLVYFILYISMMIQIIYIFNLFNLLTLFNLFSLMLSHKIPLFMIYLNFLSLNGLPPFIGFYIKFFTIKFMLFYKFYWMTLFMIMSSIISMLFYLSMISPSFFMLSKEVKVNNMMFPLDKNFNYIIFFSLLLPLQTFSFM